MLTNTINVKQFIQIIFRNIIPIALISVACGTGAYFYTSKLVTPLYTATASMYVYSDTNRSNTSVSFSELSASQELVNTYLVVLRSDTVLDQVISQLKIQLTADVIRSRLTASSINQTEAFSISYTDPDPNQAQTIANAITAFAPKEIVRVVKVGGAEVIDKATTPTMPSSPHVFRNTFTWMMIGFFVSIGIVFFKAFSDTKIRVEVDITEAYDIPIIASIPSLVAFNKSESEHVQ